MKDEKEVKAQLLTSFYTAFILSHVMRKKLVIILIAGIIGFGGLFGAWYYWTHRYDKLIVDIAEKHSLDPALVKAMVYEESFFNPQAESSQNAIGLMQITEIAAKEWVEKTGARTLAEALATLPTNNSHGREPDFKEAFSDPTVSLHVGCWYIQTLLKRYADEPDPLAVALAAYNAGPANVERWAPDSHRSNLSREQFIARIEFPVTRSYVQKIIERYDYYKRDRDLN